MYIEINHKKYLFIFLVLLQSLTGGYELADSGSAFSMIRIASLYI